MDRTVRKQKLKGLRELLSWLNKHPEVDIPYWLTMDFNIRAETEGELVANRRKLGKCDKVFTDTEIGFKHEFSGDVVVKTTIARNQVCERVQTGTRRVAEYTAPAHDEPIYEYKCPETLLVALGEGAS